MHWYYNNEGTAEGPLNEEVMISLFNKGHVTEQTLVFNTMDQNWRSVEAIAPSWLGLARQQMIDSGLGGAELEITQTEVDDKPIGLIKKLLGYFGRK